MAKIVCEECQTEFKYEIAKNFECCPVCGASLFGEDDSDHESPVEDDSHNEPADEDFNNPDLYFYAIDSEDKYKDTDLRNVWCQCTSCKEVNTISYSFFDSISQDHLKLKKDLNLKCKGCGKKINNMVVSKRPDGWRNLNLWEKDYENLPKCPVCSSTKIHKISMTNKAASALAFGILAAGHVSKTYKCGVCGSKF